MMATMVTPTMMATMATTAMATVAVTVKCDVGDDGGNGGSSDIGGSFFENISNRISHLYSGNFCIIQCSFSIHSVSIQCPFNT